MATLKIPSMPVVRAHLVDPTVTPWYPCVIRFVRRACLIWPSQARRKSWIEQRLNEVAQIVSVVALSVMYNYLHVLVHLHLSSRDRRR